MDRISNFNIRTQTNAGENDVVVSWNEDPQGCPRLFLKHGFQYSLNPAGMTTHILKDAAFLSVGDAYWVVGNMKGFVGWEVVRPKIEVSTVEHHKFIPIEKPQPKPEGHAIVVLNDGETYSSVKGSHILLISGEDATALDNNSKSIKDINPILKIPLG
jgi:hypothetical protein